VNASTSDARQLAVQVFMTTAGPALVKRVAETLAPRGIPVMPLKGVLLQKLVYGERSFRQISDVDVLVPEDRFDESVACLGANGFTRQRLEPGGWEMVLRDPSGPPLNVDLHKRLSRTTRSRLTAAGLFARAVPDTELFGARVLLPSPEDLFAHLLLHATLTWINEGRLHRPDDFEALAERLSLKSESCSEQLWRQGLITHSLVLLPLIHQASAGPFCEELLTAVRTRLSPSRSAVSAWIVRSLAAHSTTFPILNRVRGLLLAPSFREALSSAALDRIGALLLLSRRERIDPPAG
jgi:hypothetical protein